MSFSVLALGIVFMCAQIEFTYEVPQGSCVNMCGPLAGLISLVDMDVYTSVYLGAYGAAGFVEPFTVELAQRHCG